MQHSGMPTRAAGQVGPGVRVDLAAAAQAAAVPRDPGNRAAGLLTEHHAMKTRAHEKVDPMDLPVAVGLVAVAVAAVEAVAMDR